MNLMNYANAVVAELMLQSEKYDRFEVQEVEKCGKTYTGIICYREGSHVAPTVYVDQNYEQGLSPATCAKQLLVLLDRVPEAPASDEQLDAFKNFENIRDQIYIELFPVNRYSKGLVHKQVADLNATVYWMIPGLDNGCVRIKKEHLKLWGITEEELFSAAEKNHKEIEVREMGLFPGMIAEMFVFRNSESGGASVMMDPAFDEQVSDIYPEGYYIIPSSRHEVIVVPKWLKALAELRDTVYEVNRCAVKPEDVLSDSVYEIVDGKLTIAASEGEEATA